MSRPGVAVNLLRINRPQPLNAPEIVPFRSKKQLMLILVSPKSWSVSRKMQLHEVLIRIRAMRLSKILLEDHILIPLEELALVNGQSFRFLALLNNRLDINEEVVPKHPPKQLSSKLSVGKLLH